MDGPLKMRLSVTLKPSEFQPRGIPLTDRGKGKNDQIILEPIAIAKMDCSKGKIKKENTLDLGGTNKEKVFIKRPSKFRDKELTSDSYGNIDKISKVKKYSYNRYAFLKIPDMEIMDYSSCEDLSVIGTDNATFDPKLSQSLHPINVSTPKISHLEQIREAVGMPRQPIRHFSDLERRNHDIKMTAHIRECAEYEGMKLLRQRYYDIVRYGSGIKPRSKSAVFNLKFKGLSCAGQGVNKPLSWPRDNVGIDIPYLRKIIPLWEAFKDDDVTDFCPNETVKPQVPANWFITTLMRKHTLVFIQYFI